MTKFLTSFLNKRGIKLIIGQKLCHIDINLLKNSAKFQLFLKKMNT